MLKADFLFYHLAISREWRITFKMSCLFFVCEMGGKRTSDNSDQGFPLQCLVWLWPRVAHIWGIMILGANDHPHSCPAVKDCPDIQSKGTMFSPANPSPASLSSFVIGESQSTSSPPIFIVPQLSHTFPYWPDLAHTVTSVGKCFLVVPMCCLQCPIPLLRKASFC